MRSRSKVEVDKGMKKLVLVLGFAALAATSAKAELLYWRITDTGDIVYDTAAVRDVDGSLLLVNLDDSGNEAGTKVGYDYFEDDSARATGLKSGHRYQIELYDSDDNMIAYCSPIEYAMLTDYMKSNIFDQPPSTSWSPTSWISSVPEPTSGVLLVIGAGLLALKRRRSMGNLV